MHDRRLKQDIEPIPNEVLDAWADVEFVQYRFKDAVLEKGDDARIHVGLIAQNIYEVFEAHGLNAFDYGLIGYDEWPAQGEVRDESGNIVQESRKAGSIWSVRFDECQFLELALQRREMERLKAQLDSVEK
ncbi:tail fiber domain-containing protein [Shouchella clausii]|uniref:tail fiber domain-containing protein n=1 Tax=Shouchella clausii TaxID=79880 RepID=UPI0034621C9A